MAAGEFRAVLDGGRGGVHARDAARWRDPDGAGAWGRKPWAAPAHPAEPLEDRAGEIRHAVGTLGRDLRLAAAVRGGALSRRRHRVVARGGLRGDCAGRLRDDRRGGDRGVVL